MFKVSKYATKLLLYTSALIALPFVLAVASPQTTPAIATNTIWDYAILLISSAGAGALVTTIVTGFNRQTRLQLDASINASKAQIEALIEQQKGTLQLVTEQIAISSSLLQKAIDTANALQVENIDLRNQLSNMQNKMAYAEKLMQIAQPSNLTDDEVS